jgi:hypothetical protein
MNTRTTIDVTHVSMAARIARAALIISVQNAGEACGWSNSTTNKEQEVVRANA